jgi:hypothetical protein
MKSLGLDGIFSIPNTAVGNSIFIAEFSKSFGKYQPSDCWERHLPALKFSRNVKHTARLLLQLMPRKWEL